MRIAALLAASLLVAGCSQTGGHSEQTPTSSNSSASTPSSAPSSNSSASTPSSSAGTSPAPSAAPGAGAAISAVIAWIEAGRPANPGRYHTAARGGTTTALDDDIAFTAGANASCTTDAKHTGGALTCLVNLTNPPAQPDTAYGKWQGGWVDFDGTKLQIGAARADPGPFINGDGPELANGDTLSFGDYRCRADQAGLFCVNYAHQSAARIAPAGIQPFGCLRSVPPPDGVGIAFSC